MMDVVFELGGVAHDCHGFEVLWLYNFAVSQFNFIFESHCRAVEGSKFVEMQPMSNQYSVPQGDFVP